MLYSFDATVYQDRRQTRHSIALNPSQAKVTPRTPPRRHPLTRNPPQGIPGCVHHLGREHTLATRRRNCLASAADTVMTVTFTGLPTMERMRRAPL